MPSSAIETIPHMIEFIRKNRGDLRTILDIGVGFGKIGFLLREYFDVKKDNALKPEEWKLRITGIEVYEGYISELQKLVYSEIIIGDIRDIVDDLGRYDVAILSDVLEHFEKEDGRVLLVKLFDHVDDIVVGMPYGYLEHPAGGDNKFEEHKSGWELNDFQNFNIIDQAVVSRIRKSNEKVLVVYLRKN